MKCHFPQQYMAALLTSVLDNTTKVAEYIGDCKDMGIRLLPPDVNKSDADFTVDGKDLRFGLVAIKNIGWGFIHQLMEERRQQGLFRSFDDFCVRMCGKELNKRAVENLIRAGAFDSMGYNRKQLMLICSRVVDDAQAAMRDNIAGQLDLFGGFGDDDGSDGVMKRNEIPDVPEYSRQELMAMERETTGLYLSGHPMDEYREQVRRAGAVSIGAIINDFQREEGPEQFSDNQPIMIAGVVASSRTRTTKNNSLMSYINLEDDTGVIELIAFQRALDTGGGYIKDNVPLLIKGKISLRDEKEPQILVDLIRPISDVREAEYGRDKNRKKKLYLKLNSKDRQAIEHVELLLTMFPGEEQIVLYFEDTGKRLAAKCIVHEALIAELRETYGESRVAVK